MKLIDNLKKMIDMCFLSIEQNEGELVAKLAREQFDCWKHDQCYDFCEVVDFSGKDDKVVLEGSVLKELQLYQEHLWEVENLKEKADQLDSITHSLKYLKQFFRG